MSSSEDSKARSHIDQVLSGTHRAAMLIERMLTFSGRRDADAQIIKPRKRLESVFESFSTLPSQGPRMFLELSPELPAIRMDETDLDSAILNLLQNAIQAIGSQPGKITLRGMLEDKTTLPKDHLGHDITGVAALRLEIEDDGSGMTEEAASRALEPFFSTQPNGKGLGLVNVLSSVKGAGGAIWFDSKVGVGTRFVIWIPRNNEGASLI